MTTRIRCRPARRDDVRELFRMMEELATHEGERHRLLVDESAVREAGFGASPRFGALVAEVDGALAGFVSHTWTWSIWQGATLLAIDDVYVRPRHRGQGLGEHMMQAARDLARTSGAVLVRWEAKPGNDGAIRFYERLGAVHRLKRVFAWPATA